MAITDRRIGTQIYGGKAPTKYTVATGGLTAAQKAKRAARKRKASIITRAQTDPYAIAKVGDTWTSLADRLGVDQADLVKANDTQTPSAGTAVNIPSRPPSAYSQTSLGIDPNAGFDVERINLAPGQTLDEYLNPQPTLPQEPWLKGQIQDFGQMLSGIGGGHSGEQLGETINRWTQPVRDLIYGTEEGGGGKVRPSLALPQDPRGARPSDRAAYYQYTTDLRSEAPPITGPRDRASDRPGYYGFYGTEQDLAEQAAGDFSQLYNPLYDPVNPSFDPRANRPSEREAYTTKTNEAALRQMWQDVYLDPENKGRGGGIVGWIEDRIGLTIDPETFFTEGASEDVLAAMLEEFRPDELNYLESQGIIVPEEEYDFPDYGGGVAGDYKVKYNYPAPAYGGGFGQRPRQSQRPTYLGLTSWSI